ncbi:YdeI/OmpD-associated family protein [Shimazuella kribbensis]|uniref:YdeI/OmpD-associated family protein n=1 Tax=Shimazuella kribbensis TaxID=139808 RepID=UPI0003F70DE3|nr:YdeI/OmpD-associated family protein [Shimazuella kribbensis]
MGNSNNLAFLDFPNAVEWESWLTNHLDQKNGVWLRIAKKNSDKVSITITEALDVALCYGWIDSTRKSYDHTHYLQRYSPRRPKSPWSIINVWKAEVLIAAGRMQAPGFAEIHTAQNDGRWKLAYESQKNASVPPDLAAMLGQHEQAKQAFDQLDKSSQYAVMLPLLKATTAKNRAVQLQKVIVKLEAGTTSKTF